MHLFLNGLAASAGAGLTYLRNVVPELSQRSGVRTTVALSRGWGSEFEKWAGISCIEAPAPTGAVRRFWFEQTSLNRLIRDSGAEVLVSAGNFALRNSPVPQILLSGNSLYTSKDFLADLRSRGDYRLLLDTVGKGVLAKRSLTWANCTVAPTAAFAKQLFDWTGIEVSTIHHGFDHERFFENRGPLPEEIERKLETGKDDLRLLFVSHYNYYRNFETLFRAIPIVKQHLETKKVRLYLTCSLEPGKNPGTYSTESAAALLSELNIADNVIQLGVVPYDVLHLLYRSCNIYNTAAYAETFAHPLVEAMASGLPVIASDLDVHREVCGDAALYFARFSPDDLAKQILKLAGCDERKHELSGRGLTRSKDFSWRHHVDQLLGLADELIARAGRGLQ
ncbi:MAG: glycosyltransferase family 4 protein [Terriglobales bacterium]